MISWFLDRSGQFSRFRDFKNPKNPQFFEVLTPQNGQKHIFGVYRYPSRVINTKTRQKTHIRSFGLPGLRKASLFQTKIFNKIEKICYFRQFFTPKRPKNSELSKCRYPSLSLMSKHGKQCVSEVSNLQTFATTVLYW